MGLTATPARMSAPQAGPLAGPSLLVHAAIML
jgi:hypothetical protein